MISATTLIGITASTFYSQVLAFDSFINNNYQKLKQDAKRICRNDEFYEDTLHSKIEKIRANILKNGFKGENYHGAIWRAVKNQYLTNQTLKKETIDVSYLFNQSEELDEKEEYYQRVERKAKYVFEYISEYYNEKMVTLFQIYYMSNSNTYRKIVEINGYKMRYVKDCISKMKKDLRTNLDSYILCRESNIPFNRK